jgi:hypothetical protein
MELVDLGSRPRAERNHIAISYSGRLLVKRFPHPESQLPRAAVVINSPPGSNPIPLRIASEAPSHIQRPQHSVIELNRPLEIIRPEIHVAQHGSPSFMLKAPRWVACGPLYRWLHEALELLRKVHSDVAREEDDPMVKGLRDRAVGHIDGAIHATEGAVRDVRTGR